MSQRLGDLQSQIHRFKLSRLGFSLWEVQHISSLPLFSGVALQGLTLELEIYQHPGPWWILNSSFCAHSSSVRISQGLFIFLFFSQVWNWQMHLYGESILMWGLYCCISSSWILSPCIWVLQIDVLVLVLPWYFDQVFCFSPIEGLIWVI